MRNREFVFTPKIEYKLAAEPFLRQDKLREANLSNLQFPLWCSILEIVRTHFSGKFPPRKFGKVVQTLKGLQTRWAAEPHR